MTDTRAVPFGFAPPFDAPIPYLQRIRDYYQALGYGSPYEWAHYVEVPFQSLRKPLAECTVALITTAAPYQPDKGDQGPGAPYNAAAKFYRVYSMASAAEPDFPLGNAAGRPNDRESQDYTLKLALALLQSAPAARTTVQSPLRWSDDPDWKLDYCNVERLTPEEIAQRRAEFDRGKAQAKQLREEAAAAGCGASGAIAQAADS